MSFRFFIMFQATHLVTIRQQKVSNEPILHVTNLCHLYYASYFKCHQSATERKHWTCAGAIWNLAILFYPTNSQFTVKLILSFYKLSKTFFVPCWKIIENICQLKFQSQLLPDWHGKSSRTKFEFQIIWIGKWNSILLVAALSRSLDEFFDVWYLNFRLIIGMTLQVLFSLST